MENEMFCQAITANGILTVFVYAVVFGFGFSLIGWPFRRWGYA